MTHINARLTWRRGSIHARVPWLIRICGMTCLHMCRDSYPCTFRMAVFKLCVVVTHLPWHIRHAHIRCDLFSHVPWLISMHVSHGDTTWSIHVCHDSFKYIRHVSFAHVPWLIFNARITRWHIFFIKKYIYMQRVRELCTRGVLLCVCVRESRCVCVCVVETLSHSLPHMHTHIHTM